MRDTRETSHVIVFASTNVCEIVSETLSLMGGEHEAKESPSNPKKPAKDGTSPHWRKAVGWVLGVGGAFVTALATGLAGKVVDEFSGNHPSASVTQTEVRFVRPFDLEGNLQTPYKADQSKTFRGGNCVAGSIISSDPDALRCFSPSNTVLDPCWTNFRQRVACPRNPWDETVSLLQDPVIEPKWAPSPEPSSGPPATSSARWDSSTAWALEVLDPFHPNATLRCTMLGGATEVIGGNRVNWSCTNGSSGSFKGYAIGDLTKRPDKPWTVLYMEDGTSEGRDAILKTVWR